VAGLLLAPLALLDARQLILLPPVLINVALCAFFGHTLRVGKEPLVSRFARLERGSLEPELARYTRMLTWVWTLFFGGMAMLSGLLAMHATPAGWSLFTNIISYALVGVLFIAEYLYRRVRYRHYRHAPLWRLPGIVRGALRAAPVSK
jgi:uncharacterized membrane protein